MITDLRIDELKRIGKAGSLYFRYETNNSIELYHVNQGPVVFRAIIKKDDSNNWAAAMQHFPPTILLLSPIRQTSDELINEVRQLRILTEGIERRRITSR